MISIAKQFGPYRLNWLIGRGGMGEVHNAFDTRHNRYVALKLLSREVSEDQDLSARFRSEAQIVATLRHPHVVPVHGFGEIEGRLYLDMRLVEGSDLATILEAGPLPPERAVAIVEQVAGALEAAHDEGLVHRDVKPSNVLVARGSGAADFAYLVDFGIARSVDAPTVTRAEHPIGTLAYMAPERFRGARPAVSGDIYALTCLLYECLTGRRPFENVTLPDLMHAHLDEPPPKPSTWASTVAGFDDVIARGMAKDPDRRYRTATDLAVAARAVLANGPVTRRLGSQRRRAALTGRPSRGAVASLAAVSLVAIAAVVAATTNGGDKPATAISAVGENSVGLLDPSTGRLTRSIEVGDGPGAVATGFGAIWTANTNEGSVTRIDQATGLKTTLPVGAAPSGIAVGQGSVWVSNGGAGTVSRIDHGTYQTQSIPVGTSPGGVAFAAGAVWVTNTVDGTVMRIDPAQNKVVARITVGAGPGAISGGDDIWVANTRANTVSVIDPTSNHVRTTIPVGRDPEGIQVVGNDVWVTNNLDGTVSRIASATRSVTTTVHLGAGSQPTAVTQAGGMLWVGSTTNEALYQIDIGKAPRLVRSVPLGVVATGLANSPTGDAVWVTGAVDPARHRGGILLLSGERPDTIDPSYSGTKQMAALLGSTYDGLVGYRHAPGAQGSELVADLATALPDPTDSGRSYTFRLRPDIRWSDGALVTVFDVRRGLERAILSGLSLIQDEIVGAKTCTVTTCDVSGIHVDPTAGTVTIHLVRPNAAFPDQIATWCPAVPVDTPLEEQKVVPVAGTGPYSISTYIPGKSISLTRNPFFRPWSAAAQPDGYPNGIDYRIAAGGSFIPMAEAKAAVAKVEAGNEDWADARFAGPVDGLSIRFGDRLKETPDVQTWGVFLNTRIPPFNDPRVRRALNFAVNRRAAVAAWPTAARLTCQIIPPNFPGYQPYCPFTLDPSSQGAWNSPDLLSAQALVAASHTKKIPVTLWSPPNTAAGVKAVARALHDLGYQVHFKVGNPRGDFFVYVGDPRHKVQAAFVVWGADDLNGADFIVPPFACSSFSPSSSSNSNWAEFCDPSIDALMGRAQQLESTSRQAANELWVQADHDITDASPWIPLVNPFAVDTVSKRVHNYLRHPVLGVLFDQMWVV